MSTSKLLFAEISYRKLNSLLCLLAVSVSVALFVGAPMLAAGYGDKTNELVEQQQRESADKLSEKQAKNRRNLAEKRARLDAELKKVVAKNDARLAALRAETETTLAEMDKKTKRLMRDLGFNLRIVHRDTDMTRLYADFVAEDMPEEYVERLAHSPKLTKVVHLVASLKQMVRWEDRKRLLVGFAPEATQTHLEKKPPMGFQIKPGEVYLGHEAALGHKKGDRVDILGKSFTIARVLPVNDNHQDIMIAMNLKDAQTVLKKPKKISEILALGCKCKTIERLAEIREQLEAVLPETKITEWGTGAITRAHQRELIAKQRAVLLAQQAAASRELVEQMKIQHQKILDDMKRDNAEAMTQEKASGDSLLAGLSSSRQSIQNTMQSLRDVVTPLVILVSTIMVGVMMWNNVRERREEIGLLRALGKRTAEIAGLFLGKAIVLGVVGGIAGCAIGLLVVQAVGRSMEFEITNLTGEGAVLMGATLLGAPLVSALATYLPTRIAIAQDPAVVLMEQ